MIPDRVKRMLTDEYVTMLGTRNAENVPQAHRTWALRFDDDSHATVFVPHYSLERLRENIDDNGQLAVVIGHPVSHESYQLKGSASRVAEPTAEDSAAFDAYVTTLSTIWSARYGAPREFLAMLLGRLALMVTVNVREVFLQTPGPDAGRRIAPEVSS